MKFIKSSTLLLLTLIFSFVITPLGASDVEYSYVPKKVYEKQVFPISFLATNNLSKKIHFTFSGDKKPVLEKPVIIRNGKNTFFTFYFKTTEKTFKIPSVIVKWKYQERKLSALNIPVKKLPKEKNFSGVIASGLKIKNYQVSTFDEENNLITLVIEAHDANLEDIFIPTAIKDGKENKKRDGSRMGIHYYIVLPATDTSVTLTYFDTIKETFVDKIIPIQVQDASVAAQTDLNPKDDSFEALKKYILITLSIIFVALFLWKRDFFYLILAVISATVLLTFYTALAKVCVKEGVALYIIPTANSTISFYIDTKYKTTKLAERGDFVKIEYKHSIGWIKHEDLCNN